MTIVPIKFQSIIKWIPIINSIILFIYVYNSYVRGWKGKKFIIGILLLFIAVIISSIIYKLILLLIITEIWSKVINIMYIYVTCCLIGAVLVKYQSNLENR